MIRVWTFVIAVVLVLIGMLYQKTMKIEKYQYEIETGYQRALTELAANIGNMETALAKGVYAASPTQFAKLSAELWKEAALAKAALAELPISLERLENTHKFLSQVGDYAMSISNKVAMGNTLSDEERSNLLELSETAERLSQQIAFLERDINNAAALGGKSYWSALREAELSGDVETVSDGFTEMEDGMESTLTLIYDGPFSDHILDSTPKLTEGVAEVSEDVAKGGAATILQVGRNELGGAELEISNMPSYVFSDKSGERMVAFTKAGGFLSYLINSREIGEERISRDKAVEIAKRYLDEIAYTSMGVTYYEESGGVLTINFAYIQDGVTCYTDLIKVSVAMDNGEIIALDARGFIMNHEDRELPAAEISVEEAREKLSPYLEVQSFKSAVIPTSGKYESYVYEFLCKGFEDEKALVYIDVVSGTEADILLLIENENGSLTK